MDYLRSLYEMLSDSSIGKKTAKQNRKKLVGLQDLILHYVKDILRRCLGSIRNALRLMSHVLAFLTV